MEHLRQSVGAKATKMIGTHATYIAYQIQLSKNSFVFESRCPTSFVLESILVHVIEIIHPSSIEMTLWSLDIWDFLAARVVTCIVFIQ